MQQIFYPQLRSKTQVLFLACRTCFFIVSSFYSHRTGGHDVFTISINTCTSNYYFYARQYKLDSSVITKKTSIWIKTWFIESNIEWNMWNVLPFLFIMYAFVWMWNINYNFLLYAHSISICCDHFQRHLMWYNNW